MTQREHTLRAVREGDWSQIGALANAAVKSVAEAPRQDEWVENRRRFRGERAEMVAAVGDQVLGYAAVERRPEDPHGTYRVFLVTDWEEAGDVGQALYEWAEAELGRREAHTAWLREYARDAKIAAFVGARGFGVRKRYELDGVEMVTLQKELRSPNRVETEPKK
jgi:hypothetical protein